MNRMLRPVFLVLLAVLAACDAPALVTSPIAGSAPAPADKRLLGIWAAPNAEKSGSQLVVVVAAFETDAQGHMAMRLTLTEFGDPMKNRAATTIWSRWLLQRTRLKAKRYFSARLVAMGNVPQTATGKKEIPAASAQELARNPVYILGWPEIDPNGNLTLHLMAEDEIKNLKAEKMAPAKGMSKGMADLARVTWSVSSDALAAKIENADPARLFRGRFGPFIRIEPRPSGRGLWSVRK